MPTFPGPFPTNSVVTGVKQATPASPLAFSLDLPLSAMSAAGTQALGIHQSDVIIRSALTVGLADMRANPWLLDYVFASLPQDSLTWKEYGEKSVQQAKQWFLGAQIPVKMVPVADEAKLPCISISLVDSTEATNETTIGDVHSQSFETLEKPWGALTSAITPVSYNSSTGVMILHNLPEEVYLAAGMFVIDRTGKSHEILVVYDGLTLGIAPGTVADFRGALLKSGTPGFVTSIESSSYRETYRIGLHVGGEPVLLTWLHSIVVFCLLRYKEVLLEGRGFERSTMQSSDFAREAQFDSELVFSRYLTVSGYVRQYWPKVLARPIDAVVMDPIRVSGQDQDVRVADTGLDPDEQLWVGNLDTINPAKRKDG